MTRTGNTKTRKGAGKPKELSEAHKRKMLVAKERKKKEREKAEAKEEQSELRATIKRLQDHVAKTERENDKLYAKYEKASSEKNFNSWLQANSKLLNAVTALKAHEERLRNEG
jgi:uncharacterized protein (DUF3084 family)